MELDEICKLAISGKTGIEDRINTFSRIYLRGKVNVFSLNDLLGMQNESTLYIIQSPIDLRGITVTIPRESIIYFKDDTYLQNGILLGNDTRIISKNQVIFKKGHSTYHGYLKGNNYQYVGRNDGSLIIGGTWDNKIVADLWTELINNDANNCQALAINNMINLYSKAVTSVVPCGVYYIYDWIRILARSVDFQGSEIRSIDFNKVENLSIPLPDNVKSVSLQSRYGLLDFNAEDAFLKNITIDGRASSREEKPKLGSQCLITITGGSNNGLFENVVLTDAVDCDVCTGSIAGFTFRNVTFGSCGEHGLYTHAFNGNLVFDNCVFDNCGQSLDLFKKRGISGCIRGAASSDHQFDEMTELVATFYDCSFINSGNINVATIYTDIPKAEFYNCRWIGNVVGYIANNPAYNEASGKMYEYNFYGCDNPCGSYNAKNTIRKLINCSNVRNPFQNTYLVENCDIVVCYDDVNNRFEGSFTSEVENPVVFKKCSFRKTTSEGGVRSTIINPRPMEFLSCSWIVSNVQERQKGQSLLLLKDSKGNTASADRILFQDCIFNIPDCRLITCIDTDILFQGGEYQASYDVLVLGGQNRPNRIELKSFKNLRQASISR